MIYIVEDDENIREMQSYALRNSGYETECFEDGAEFFVRIKRELPELVILDIMLPGEDGLSILKRLRENPATSRIPIIIVSAKSSELDAVRGLDSGADDYITKPFGIMELISRVKAVLRRIDVSPVKELKLGGISMDDERHIVTVNGEVCALTYKEYELLKVLLLNRGIVLSRERLMVLVWGTDFAGESRTVDMHIKSLRRKLGICGELIKTVRNVGYKIEENQ
ncbi:MAG: response regulator transcription factor [Christensenellaceae bacterium]|nr:response regulator transcription factor [Christensenellaceae bacterium]